MQRSRQLPKNQNQIDLWRNALQSANEKTITDILLILQKEGDVKILPEMFQLYNEQKGTIVGKEIYNFLRNVKHPDAKEMFIEAIKNPALSSIEQDILSLCWQSTLNFNEYILFFVETFIKNDIQSAFEAFTVLEYTAIDKEDPQINNAILKLKHSVDVIEERKKPLLVDLVNILKEKQK